MRMVLSLKHLATLLVASMAAADLKCTNLKKRLPNSINFRMQNAHELLPFLGV
jgi:hypothetical protein